MTASQKQTQQDADDSIDMEYFNDEDEEHDDRHMDDL
jgi:hypothetical protein